MKKILLSIIFFTGLISFSSKENNSKQKVNGISTTISNNKKVIKITGPRYRVEGALGTLITKESTGSELTSVSVAVLPEWKAQMSTKFDITFGPKITTNVSIIKTQTNFEVRSSLILGMEANLNYKLKENLKIYSGVEIGTGISYLKVQGKSGDGFNVATIGKISTGIKIRDKYNIGIYTGNVKGLLGLEVGYTF
ncbi:hypothetical protein [Streptobacillus ratti]|uniref:hypothetical protein n=1 Tax=Streptobacillus ratti TaxID=1720557 RepID=UPI00093275E8|nr:hypothetical protein [Streptobacillus ratti]